jgi:hypothetical protein
MYTFLVIVGFVILVIISFGISKDSFGSMFSERDSIDNISLEDAKISGGEAVGDRENSGQRNSKEFDIIVENVSNYKSVL